MSTVNTIGFSGNYHGMKSFYSVKVEAMLEERGESSSLQLDTTIHQFHHTRYTVNTNYNREASTIYNNTIPDTDNLTLS